MHPQKHTANQAAGTAPADAGFGSTRTDRAMIERQARFDRAAVIGGWIGGGIAKLVASIRTANRRRQAMAELAALDNRMLADIGISRSEIRAAVSGASGFLPRALSTSAMTPSLNDDSLNRAA